LDSYTTVGAGARMLDVTATPAELAIAYGKGARDAIIMLAMLPDSDRFDILYAIRKKHDEDRFILCDAGKHYIIRTKCKLPCPWCEWKQA
jgi:hypothetical protein